MFDKKSGGGFAASQARYVMLTSRKSDLEFQGQTVNQQRMQIANQLSGLFNVAANLEPGSVQAQQLQSRIAALQQIDKTLELQLNRVGTQRDAVETEIDSVRKIIEKNIGDTFKISG